MMYGSALSFLAFNSGYLAGMTSCDDAPTGVITPSGIEATTIQIGDDTHPGDTTEVDNTTDIVDTTPTGDYIEDDDTTEIVSTTLDIDTTTSSTDSTDTVIKYTQIMDNNNDYVDNITGPQHHHPTTRDYLTFFFTFLFWVLLIAVLGIVITIRFKPFY